MKVLVAIDAFKGAASSSEVAAAVERGIRKVSPESEVSIVPVSDGGEGLLEAYSSLEDTLPCTCICQDPLGRKAARTYLIVNRHTAVIESARVCGLPLLQPSERDPLSTSSYGLGEMIQDALDRGIRDFVIGLGGSATNDAGLGMLRALGCRFLDQDAEEITLAKALPSLYKIDLSEMDKRLYKSHFFIASDVDNPLCGAEGASQVYAPQKGADSAAVRQLEQGFQHFAMRVTEQSGRDFSEIPGAGAAGGLGFAFVAFLHAVLGSGIERVLEILEMEQRVIQADIVITGEGKVDRQSVRGKVVSGIAALCKKQQTRCLVLSGDTEAIDPLLYEGGVSAVFCIQNRPRSLEASMQKETTLSLVTQLSEALFRILR